MKEEIYEATHTDKKQESAKLTLDEGIDYYLENGLMVFTSHFLLKRGYCCDNGCRHCPYKSAECGMRSAEVKTQAL